MGEQWTFTEVSVAGGPPVHFCVDPAAGDPVAPWLLEHDWIDEPVQRMFVGLVEPGMRVLDLGSHLGTFSLPAAVLGAEVLAVDGSADHVELLRASALHNGFDSLRVVHAVIAPPGHPTSLEFVVLHIHGHVRVGHVQTASEAAGLTVDVPAATVDELLERHGWETVDLVKMDIEGAEPAALAGMSRLFDSGRRPPIVLECNGAALPLFGSAVPELREALAQLGYELLLIDHLRPGTLVEADAQTLQAECVCDLLATTARPHELSARWTVEPPFGREQLLSRLLDSAASEAAGYRAYAARLMIDGPQWLRSAPEARAAMHALSHDIDAEVRDAVALDHKPSWAVESMLSAEPPGTGPPPDIVVWAEGVSVRRPSTELDPVHAPRQPPADELLISDAWLHVRGGQLIGILAEVPDAGSLFLRVLSGRDEPAVGLLEVAARPLLLSPLCVGLELGLSVAENVMVLGEFLGLPAAAVSVGLDHVADIVGLTGQLGTRLDFLPALKAVELTLATALGLRSPELLLLDAIAPTLDGRFASWARDRISELREDGGAVVQLITEADDLLGQPDRVLWIAGGRVQASGHPDSVLEAHRRNRLGLSPQPLDHQPSRAMGVPR